MAEIRAGRLIISDLSPAGQAALEALAPAGDRLFPARPEVDGCMACLGCWLKTPGTCVRPDRCAGLAAELGGRRELLLISPLGWAGYSVAVKAMVDRLIGYMLPDFCVRAGEMHHPMRYDGALTLRAWFYDAGDGEAEALARRLAEHNALNLDAEDWQARFFPDEGALLQALREEGRA